MADPDEDDLEISPEPLASGGNAEILRGTWRGTHYIYKRFKPHFHGLVDVAALERMVRWRLGLDDGTRLRLDRVCAWPLAIVRRRAQAVGILVPVAPVQFMLPASGQNGRPGVRSLSKVRLLDADLAEEEAPAAVPAALAAVGLAARVVLWLHEQGVIVNDVQPENILVDARSSRVYLVDCDSMVSPYWGEVAPAMAPTYLNDVLPGRPSEAVDLAKLSWCVFFVLLRDFSPRSIGADVRRQMARYLPTATVTLLARAATEVDHGPWWRQFWSERCELWIQCGREGVLVTDSGWRAVAPPTEATGAGWDGGWLARTPPLGTPTVGQPPSAIGSDGPTRRTTVRVADRPPHAAPRGRAPKTRRMPPRSWLPAAAATAAVIAVASVAASVWFLLLR